MSEPAAPLPATIDTLVVGGGQAGLATSAHLARHGIAHLVLERGRVAEHWRSRRWDSLVANGPAWHDRFPDLAFDADPAFATDPDGFATARDVAAYFEAYAKRIDAPLRCGVEVTRVARLDGRQGYRVETSHGLVEALNVVAATGPFQKPVIPPLVPREALRSGDTGVRQIHSADYRNPDGLVPGAVLVVGAGSSGAQIADELQRAGRRVFLSVGPHNRPPRAYRGLDYCWWLGVLGHWDAATPAAGAEHVTIAVSGARGGSTVDFREFAARGITLLGRAEGFEDAVMTFARDLADNITRGDANLMSVLDEADAFATRNGLDLPPDPAAREIGPDPDCLARPILSLDLAAKNIAAIVWATGYAFDFSWIDAATFDASPLDGEGRPVHERGVAHEPGFHFVGLPWQSRRGSSFIWGVWHDAAHIAERIALQRGYRDYREARAAAPRRAAE